MRENFCPQNPVFVFNCSFNGLAIIQELGLKGIEVYALDSVRDVGTFSRYAKFKKCPDPITDEEKFIKFIEQLASRLCSPPVLFPTNDHWAMAISKHKERLMSVSIPCVASWRAMKTLIFKDEFYKWGALQNYPVPKTWDINDINKIKNFPIVAKPKYRRISSIEQGTKNLLWEMDKNRLVVINSKKELDTFLFERKKIISHFIFQEYIKGMANQMYTIGIYADDKSDIKAIFTGRKIRGNPPDIGDCIVGESYNLPYQLTEMVKEIVRKIRYSGIAEFEFKKDAQTQEFKLIEINPRSWSWIGITPYCNVSIPWIAYTDLTDFKKLKNPIISNVPPGSVKYIKVLQDFLNCLFFYKKIGYADWSLNFNEWKKSIVATKKIYAEFSNKDYMVALYAVYSLTKSLIIDFLKKIIEKIIH